MKLVSLFAAVCFAVAAIGAFAGGSDLLGHVFGIACTLSVLGLCQPKQ